MLKEGTLLEEKPLRNAIAGLNSDLILTPATKWFDFFQLNQEWACLYKDKDISSYNKDIFAQAYRIKNRLKGFFYELGLGGKIIGNHYEQLGNIQLKENSYEFGANLDFRPTKYLFYNTDFFLLKNNEREEDYKNKFTVVPTKYNKIILTRRDYLDVNSVDKKENLNKIELFTFFTNFEIILGAIYNEFKQKRPEYLKDIRYEKGGLIQIATKNIKFIQTGTSVELTENDSATNGIYKKLKINSDIQFSYKEKYQLLIQGSYTKGELHTIQLSTNNPPMNKPTDETWIVDSKMIIKPHPVFENETTWKINNYKEPYENIYKEIIQNVGSTKTTLIPAKSIHLDYQFSTIFNIRKDTKQKTQWEYNHMATFRFLPIKEIINQAFYQEKIKNIRVKLEPEKKQKEDTKEFKDALKIVPIVTLSLNFNTYYKEYKKEGYYDIGIDDLTGDHTLKPAILKEITKHLDTDIKKNLKEKWLLGTSFAITRYQLKDDYKISYTRFYVAEDNVTAAKLSDTDYQELIFGLNVTYTPLNFISFILNFNRSYLIDKTGFYSPKTTYILKPVLNINFINFTVSLDGQYDSSYYFEEHVKPSRLILRGNVNYHYKNNLSLTGRISYEDSKKPDYNYLASSVNLEISF